MYYTIPVLSFYIVVFLRWGKEMKKEPVTAPMDYPSNIH